MFTALPHPEAGKMVIKPIKMSADNTKGMESVREPLHQTSFFYLVVGPPGSSKTTTMLSMLTNKAQFGRKYDEVHWFSPSMSTVKIPLPPNRLHGGDLDLANVERVIKKVPKGKRLLMVFDDVVSSLPPGNKYLRPFIRMIYNRRHLMGGGGTCSCMLVSQKLSMIPRQLRAAADGLIYFRTSNLKEIKTCYEEYASISWSAFLKLLEFAWSDKYSFLFARLDRREDDRRWHRNFEEIKMLGTK